MAYTFNPFSGNFDYYESDPYNLGYFATESALILAHPTGTDGQFAIVGETDTIWVWDSDSSAWVDTDTKGQVSSVFGRTGVVTSSENDYTWAQIDKTISSIGDLTDVTLTPDKTLTITESTTLSGGTHSGDNTGDQDISGLVPYTGATGNVDLGTYDLTTTGESNFGSTTIGTSGSHFELNTVTYDIAGLGNQTFPIIIPTSESAMTDMGGVFRRALIIEGATDGIGYSNPEIIMLSKDFSTSLKLVRFGFTESTETLLVGMLDLTGGTPSFTFEIDGDIEADNLNISDWDTAYGWGDHAGLYDVTGTAQGVMDTHELAYDHTLIATALQTETDPEFAAWLLATPPLYPGGWYDTLQSSVDISGFNNDSGFITGVAWDEITGTQSDISLSGFTDDLSYEVPLTFSTGLTRTVDTITCDITQYTNSDAIAAIQGDASWNASDWDTAYGWGDHSSEGYIVNPMTTAGDVIYGGASGVPTRLPKGTATQVLTMNAGATAPEWADASSPSYGNYTIEHDAVEDELVFKYSGSTIMKLETDGTLHVKEIIEDI